VTATEAYLTQSMMEPQADVVAGFDPVMPTYLGELTSAEVAGIVEFIKSLEAGGSSARVKLPDVRVPDEAAAADEPETGAGGAAGAPATNGGTEP
jgi:cytochrome c oxidase subunit 2